jgi:predicted metalloendopeptidase
LHRRRFAYFTNYSVGIQLTYLASNLYSRLASSDVQRLAAIQMMDDLRSAFASTLNENTWMDDETRLSASAKLDNLTFIIGNPKWTNDTVAVSDFHADLSFNPLDYFQNSISAQAFNEFSISKRALQAGGWIRSDELFGYPWQVNAFHLTGILSILTFRRSSSSSN